MDEDDKGQQNMATNIIRARILLNTIRLLKATNMNIEDISRLLHVTASEIIETDRKHEMHKNQEATKEKNILENDKHYDVLVDIRNLLQILVHK